MVQIKHFNWFKLSKFTQILFGLFNFETRLFNFGPLYFLAYQLKIILLKVGWKTPLIKNMDLIGKWLLENKDLLDRAYRRWPDTTLISVLIPQLSSFSELIEQINLIHKNSSFLLCFWDTWKLRNFAKLSSNK